MHFALIEEKRCEAKKGVIGICPFCGASVIAKCGCKRINHWAHKDKTDCDNWLETETEWHRNWKNNFPTDWQEKIFIDSKTNEKHIADICTDKNFVIEFQHSQISSKERISREHFYKNMVWVVDGTNLKDGIENFSKQQINKVLDSEEPSIFEVYNANMVFPRNWLKSDVLVFFDYSGVNSDNNSSIFALFPNKIFDVYIVIRFEKRTFIDYVTNNNLLDYFENIKLQLKSFYSKKYPFMANKWLLK